MKLQDLQKKSGSNKRKIKKLKKNELLNKKEIDQLTNANKEILKEDELESKKESQILKKRISQSKYSLEISYPDKRKKILSRHAKSLDEYYRSLDKLSAKNKLKAKKNTKKKLIKINRNFITPVQLKKMKKINLKTSFETLQTSNFRPSPINRQAARAVGIHPKKKY